MSESNHVTENQPRSAGLTLGVQRHPRSGHFIYQFIKCLRRKANTEVRVFHAQRCVRYRADLWSSVPCTHLPCAWITSTGLTCCGQP